MTGEKARYRVPRIPRTAEDQAFLSAFRDLKREYRPHRSGPEPLRPEPVSLVNDFQTFAPSFEEMIFRIMRNFTGIRVPKGEGLQGLNVAVTLTPDEAATGGTLSVGVPVFSRCPFCGGVGRQWLFPCLGCGGEGTVEEEERLDLRVPPMVTEGSVLEAPLLSLGIRNLYLRVHIRID